MYLNEAERVLHHGTNYYTVYAMVGYIWGMVGRSLNRCSYLKRNTYTFYNT